MLGALAVAAPILFHLIRRTTRDKIPISSLMFLQPSPPRVTKRSRIENWVLLLLRCLIICLLALGFARPFLQQPMASDTPENLGQRVVMLLDHSASMRRDNLWEELRQGLASELEEIPARDEVAVYFFGDRLESVIAYEEWNGLPPTERASATLARLRDSQPQWGGTRLGPALLNAVEILEDREKAESFTARQRIVVWSDFQEGSRLEGLQGFEWPNQVEVELRPLRARKPTNAGLQILSDRRRMAIDTTNDQSSIAVRVTNAADSDREQFRLFWSDPRTSQTLGDTLDVYVPPGQSRMVQVPLAPDAGEDAKLVLSGDEETFDNQAFHVPPALSTVPVWFLGTSGAEDPQGMRYYLERAFEDSMRRRIEIVPAAPRENLPGQTLAQVRLAIATRPLTEEELATMEIFVRGGKTLLLTLRSTAEANTLATLAATEGVRAEEARVNRYAMLGQIDFSHPLLAPFADPRYSDFTKIHFWKHRKIDTNGLSNARVVARFDDGSPALMELPLGRGRLFVLTSGWHPDDSQLALSSKFVPLLYSLLDYSGALPNDASSFHVGEEVPLIASSSADSSSVVRKPDGTEADVAEMTSFADTDQPGLYTVTTAGGARRFSVNVAPEESRTAPLSVDILESLGVPVRRDPISGVNPQAREARQLRAAELESRQKLWRWLLVAALGLLLMEIWLAGRLSRRPVAEPA